MRIFTIFSIQRHALYMINFCRQFLFFCMLLYTCFETKAHQILTLNQAIKLGLENGKNLKLSKAKLDIANAKYNEAIDATIPSLKVLANYTRYNNVPPFVAPFPGSAEPVTLFP